MTADDLTKIKDALRKFAEERDWDQFHSPKNLSMALTSEAGELLELFQWLTEEQSFNVTEQKKGEIEEEIADILIYLIRLADKLNIDLLEAVNKKININQKKYPTEKVKGSAKKYNEYE